MNTVTLTSDYKLIFPREIRETAGLEAGTSYEVIIYNNRIELIPIKPIKNLRGLFAGINTDIIRDDDRL